MRDAIRHVDISCEEHFFQISLCGRPLKNVSLCDRHCGRPPQTLCRARLSVAREEAARLLFTGEVQRQEAAHLSARVGTGTQAATWLPQLCALGEAGHLASLVPGVPDESVEEHLSPGPLKSPFHYAAGATAGAWPGPSGLAQVAMRPLGFNLFPSAGRGQRMVSSHTVLSETVGQTGPATPSVLVCRGPSFLPARWPASRAASPRR